jgi:uncharacterized protein YkwD
MTIFGRCIAALLILGVGLFCATEAADTGSKPKLKLSAAEQKLVDLTNQERKKENLPALLPNPILFAAARAHSANMAKKGGDPVHVLDGKDVYQRLDAAKYHWLSAGENIALGTNSSLQEVMKGWMDSKGHRENILKTKYTEIGIGIADAGKGNLYYTVVFGREKKKKKAD